MIERIVVENFKSFKKVDLKLGQMNLFIGTNASGKSNFFDALRVIQGIGYGLTVREIFDGKPKSAGNVEWQLIRGGSVHARYRDTTEQNIQLTVDLNIKGLPLQFAIALNPLSGRVNQESLTAGHLSIYDSTGAPNSDNSPVLAVKYLTKKGRGRKPHLEFERSRPVLWQIARNAVSEEQGDTLKKAAEALSNMQRIDPQPDILRGYSQAQRIERMGERGENMAALVRTISEKPERKEAFLAWLKELRPTEVEDVLTLQGALEEPLFALKERGKEFPAPVLSDGTLRFAAIAAVFFQPDMPDILTIEEIEKGIHDSRLRLMLEMLKSQAKRDQVQVMATSHSRSILDWLEPDDYKTTFHCHRNPETGESRITALAEIPHFPEAVKNTPLGDLFAENWLEAAS
jgi:predicted ATPase